MKWIISTLFAFGLIAFIGIWYLLLGGSAKLMGVGFGMFTLLVIILSITFSLKVLQNSDSKTRLIILAYFVSAVTMFYGLGIRIIEGIGRYQHPVGLKVFYIGLGSLIVLLIIQFFYILFYMKED